MTALLAYIDTGAAIGLLLPSVTRRIALCTPSRATLIEAGSITAMVGLIAMLFVVCVAIGAVAGIVMGG